MEHRRDDVVRPDLVRRHHVRESLRGGDQHLVAHVPALRVEEPAEVIPTVSGALTMVFQGGNAVAVLLTQKLLGAKAF